MSTGTPLSQTQHLGHPEAKRLMTATFPMQGKKTLRRSSKRRPKKTLTSIIKRHRRCDLTRLLFSLFNKVLMWQYSKSRQMQQLPLIWAKSRLNSSISLTMWVTRPWRCWTRKKRIKKYAASTECLKKWKPEGRKYSRLTDLVTRMSN